MFLQYTINRLGYLFTKVSLFTIPLFFLLTISSISYAETKDDTSLQEEKVRKAVINQLFLLGGKSKQKEEKTNEVAKAEKTKTVEKTEEVAKAEKAKTIEKTEEVAKAEKAKTVEKTEEVAKAEKAKTIEKTEEVAKAKEAKKIEKTEEVAKAKKAKTVTKTKEVAKAEKAKKIEKTEKVAKTEKANTGKKTKEAVKADQSTPVIELLTEKEVQKLMLDVMKSPNPPSPSKTATVSTPPQPNQDKKKKVIANKTETDKTDEKKTPEITKKTESDAVPVGRKQLSRNTTPEKMTGWIYLGRFQSKKWESQTLDVKKELPKVGKQYAIQATMVNVRDALPKKGKMGKAVKLLRNKAEVKILQLRGLGRNRDHYWAKIKY